MLQTRSGAIELKTAAESSPKPKARVYPQTDVNITWWLNNLDESNQVLPDPAELISDFVSC